MNPHISSGNADSSHDEAPLVLTVIDEALVFDESPVSAKLQSLAASGRAALVRPIVANPRGRAGKRA